ncbi:acetyl-coenzyme A carboxylase carboxyl transferase subunit beta [Vallitalea longa]|uniref:Acetyl-coenzyme A carboxylase carboxyl transferase subunit beta n=1 Tax=Vallitalea longa TaxID=2936439 RepID=A0A9W5YG23_9FIRM|nr:acetyl-CoA carboxylase, carboxyltransferase subunit beta [Vallitalea longa]GKX31850.1 acetyl-coenzyme A carboxylase carboxyl transferase subunit beta [Vallitalea longa]
MKELFKKKKYIKLPIKTTINNKEDYDDVNDPSVPSGKWIKCNNCGEIIYKDDFDAKNQICTKCHKHFRMDSESRISQVIDSGSFKELNADLITKNVLDFPEYLDKINCLREKTGLVEGVITGEGKINGIKVVIAVMDSRFMMGSMGEVVGEKITRAIEHATSRKLPIIIFTASGGARMQEGIVSLMQMAKTSAALAKHSESGLLYITVLTDPTTGGVTASFAMLGDIILAEPGTLIGFAGARVIEQTINQKLPEGFQRAEFLLEHGYIDMIVERRDMKGTLYKLLKFHC